MYVWIESVQIAECSLQPIPSSFQEHKGVSGPFLTKICDRTRKSQLERHIEARGDSNSAQVVNRNLTVVDQLKQPFQPTSSALRDF